MAYGMTLSGNYPGGESNRYIIDAMLNMQSGGARMQTENMTITLTPSLYNQLNRLKSEGNFPSDQALIQASFEALDREWQRSKEFPSPMNNRYMSRPGLSPDDYDT